MLVAKAQSKNLPVSEEGKNGENFDSIHHDTMVSLCQLTRVYNLGI